MVVQFRTQRKKEEFQRARSVCAAKGKGGHSKKGASSGGHRKTGKKWLEKKDMLQRNDKSAKRPSHVFFTLKYQIAAARVCENICRSRCNLSAGYFATKTLGGCMQHERN